MLRHLSAARTFLSRYSLKFNCHSRGPVFCQSSRCIYKEPRERDPCPPPPPLPPPPPKDDRLFWGMIALAVCATAFAMSAKYNPEVRDWVTIHAPWFDDFIALMHEENQTYSEYIKCRLTALKETIMDYFTEKEPCVLDSEGKVVVVQGPKLEEEECKKPPPPVVTQNICEIEKCLTELAETVINNYYTAKEACRYYNKLVLASMTEFSMCHFQELHAAMAERRELVDTSVSNATGAKEKLAELTNYLDCGVKASKEQIAATKQLIEDMQLKIKAENMEYQWQNDQSVALDSQWTMVETLMNQYTSENKTVNPMLDYYSDKPHIIGGNPDLLLHHTLRYLKHLQSQLYEAQEAMTERVNRGVETGSPQNEQNRKKYLSLIDSSTKKARGELDKSIKTRLDDLKKRNDLRLQTELKKALDASQKNLEIQLKMKEAEITKKLDKLVADKVASEKRIFKALLEDMGSKVAAVEDKLKAHLKADAEARRCHELWAAGSALLAATKRGDPIIDIRKELKAVEKAAAGEDPLVTSVLKAIPESVREEGLVPVSQLQKKYHSMESTALKVALIEQDGARLPVYFLSYLQWALLCLRLSDIPKVEIDKPPSDNIPPMDTFDLLLRSRYWVERGNIGAALRYVAALEGASWAAANTWRRHARALLETRLAAEAVIAHAAALALRYI